MANRRYSERNILTRQATSTVSVTLVLLILGLIAVVATGTRQVTEHIRSEVGFTVVLNDDIDHDAETAIVAALRQAPYTGECQYRTAADIAAEWERDNGEDIIEVLGVNPFGATLDIHVKSQYSPLDSLTAIADRVSALDGVDAVELNTELVKGISANLNLLSVILGGVAAALLLVSFVLINNTVWLAVHSRRFIIHTMKLVGATEGFIRRPFIKSGIWSGAIAGIIGSLLLAGLLHALHTVYPVTEQFTGLDVLWWVYPALVAAGVLICATASVLATNRYLKLDYDSLV